MRTPLIDLRKVADITLKAVRGSKADMIPTETEGSKASGTTENSLMVFFGSCL